MPRLYLCCQISSCLDFYWMFVSGSSFIISCILNCLICKWVQWSVTLYLRPTTYMRIGGLLLWRHETSTLGWAVELHCVLSCPRLEATISVALFRLQTSKLLPHPTAVRTFHLLCIMLICNDWGMSLSIYAVIPLVFCAKVRCTSGSSILRRS